MQKFLLKYLKVIYIIIIIIIITFITKDLLSITISNILNVFSKGKSLSEFTLIYISLYNIVMIICIVILYLIRYSVLLRTNRNQQQISIVIILDIIIYSVKNNIQPLYNIIIHIQRSKLEYLTLFFIYFYIFKKKIININQVI